MKDELGLCKELYFRELDRKSALTNALALPIGMSTLISSGLLYVANEVSTVENRVELLIVLIIILGGFSLLAAVFYLCKSYIGYTYKYIPTLAAVRSYRVQLREYHNENSGHDPKSTSESTEYFIETLSLTAQTNFDNNNRKTGYIYLANRALVVALGLLLFAIVPLIFSEFDLSFAILKIIINGS